jgi:hypothetical protein
MKKYTLAINQIITLVISLSFFNTNILFAQSKKDIIASLEYTRDSLNGIIENERKDFKIQSQDYSQKKWHFEQQIEESNRIISERNKLLDAKISFINQLEKSVKDKIIINTELTERNKLLRDSLDDLMSILLEFQLGIELNSYKISQPVREENGVFDHQRSSPDVDLLFFSNDYGFYQLFVNYDGAEIRYSDKSNRYKEYELCYILKNGKIIVSVDNLSYETQKPSDIYRILNGQFCVYNPENDDYDCSIFDRSKSTCDLAKYFK